jgi:hypothetical protein
VTKGRELVDEEMAENMRSGQDEEAMPRAGWYGIEV